MAATQEPVQGRMGATQEPRARALLAGLGYSAAAIERLMQEGVVGAAAI